MKLNVDFTELYEAVEAMGATPIDFKIKLGNREESCMVNKNLSSQNEPTEDTISEDQFVLKY